jgi:crossover junction endodeoxyribonuclease RuvC
MSSTFRFGASYGTMLRHRRVGNSGPPCVPPKWKKALGLNSDAETSRARAVETWPTRADLCARKRDHNRAEAALLGRFGLENGGGQP